MRSKKPPQPCAGALVLLGGHCSALAEVHLGATVAEIAEDDADELARVVLGAGR